MGVTKAGAAELANQGTNDSSPAYWTYLAFGSGTTAFANTQTTLVTEKDRVAATESRVTTTHANDTMRFTATFTITSSTACTITEVAIFNAASGGDMLARTVLSTSRTVTADQVYALIYDVDIQINP